MNEEHARGMRELDAMNAELARRRERQCEEHAARLAALGPAVYDHEDPEVAALAREARDECERDLDDTRAGARASEARLRRSTQAAALATRLRPTSAVPRTDTRSREAGRPRAQPARSSAKSGDSGDDDPHEPSGETGGAA